MGMYDAIIHNGDFAYDMNDVSERMPEVFADGSYR